MTPGNVMTCTRATAQFLVTEYGKVNLKGLSTWQRAEGIVNLAHPNYRDELITKAEEMHIWLRSNKK
jgi:acyl-CoA hydrolase